MATQSRIGTHRTTVRAGHDGRLSVVYHGTEVVARTPLGIVLNSGGWRTSTTKTRMNQASNQYGLGFHVFQRDSQWYVSYLERDRPFVDGMILTLDVAPEPVAPEPVAPELTVIARLLAEMTGEVK